MYIFHMRYKANEADHQSIAVLQYKIGLLITLASASIQVCTVVNSCMCWSDSEDCSQTSQPINR